MEAKLSCAIPKIPPVATAAAATSAGLSMPECIIGRPSAADVPTVEANPKTTQGVNARSSARPTCTIAALPRPTQTAASNEYHPHRQRKHCCGEIGSERTENTNPNAHGSHLLHDIPRFFEFTCQKIARTELKQMPSLLKRYRFSA